MVTRQAARVAKGWKVADIAKVAELAASELLGQVLPYARAEITEHKDAGRILVLATTTPHDLVAPLAEALGFDEVIATRYGRKGGEYDGTIQGEFVWGRGKARAVRQFADEHGIDLDASYAYSDSYYDVPLLSIVGHPYAINPDPRMAAVAALRRWPQKWFDVPVGVPKLVGLEPQTALYRMVRPEFFPYARFRIYGEKRIPRSGGAILVANHRSYFDPIAIGLLLSKVGRPVRFLGKKEVFDAPIVGDIARAMGGIRVDRGTGSDVPIRAAEEALEAGDLVAVMPQGTIPRGREFFAPELKGRWGAMKLAHATGVPIIPIGMWGTEEVWPRSSRLPNVTNVLSPPTVTIRVGKPVEIGGVDVDADTTTMMEAISALLPAEARRPYEPTAEELARTVPPGGQVDDEREAARRPGSD
jgi:putative phosphoserine phosphatase/1-acylglycerol-3-phosphate O-acyltransferase